MGFRFVHMADVHLDTPFSSRDEGLRKDLRDKQRQSFENAIKFALSENVDAILIAGDLFDNDMLSFATEKFLQKQMEILDQKGIEVFYAPGNHDPFGDSYCLEGLKWPKNVHIFKKSTPESYTVHDDCGKPVSVIVGAGHEGSREGRNIVSGFPKAEGSVPYIGLIHAFVAGVSGIGEYDRYAPCSMEDLASKDYSYWALGHIHSRMELNRFKPTIVYPGNLMGRNFGEEGIKGVYEVEINDIDDIKAVFHPITSVCFTTISVGNLKEVKDLSALESLLVKCGDKFSDMRSIGSEIFLRIILKGQCPLYDDILNEENMDYLTETIREALKIKYLEINAENITRKIDLDEYRGGPHILGTVLSIIDKLKYDDDLLLKLSPRDLAIGRGLDDDEKVKYLRSLLEGIDSECASRMIKGASK